MGAIGETGLIIVALALLWVGIAAALSLAAARRFRLAEQVLGAARSNATLLEISPARPLVVRSDGRIEADRNLVRELGLKSSPKVLQDLHGNDSGILSEDLEALTEEIATGRISGSRVSMRIRVAGSSRVFEVRGQPAPAPEPAGTLLLWFFDMSPQEEERA